MAQNMVNTRCDWQLLYYGRPEKERHFWAPARALRAAVSTFHASAPHSVSHHALQGCGTLTALA